MRHWLKTTPLLLILLLVAAAPASAEPTVQEFSDGLTASAGLADIVLGPDGKLWFAEKDASKVGRLTPGSPPVIDEFPLPVGFTQPFNITVGPDNKIWATATNGAPAVVRIDPSNPADFVGTGGYGLSGSPAGIAAGPDGKIWLGSQGGVVARIDPATMNEEAVSDIPLTGFNIRNLAPGPDGNVWVTDFGGQIGMVTPSGTVTAFNPAGDAAWDIVPGPDGNLWYTAPEGTDTKIGRVTPAGDVGLQYSATPVGDQRGITVGPDGALWFAQAFANSIGRMTLDGQFTEEKGLTAGARPEYIAAGPENTLWFTEKDGNRIGRITGIEVGGGGGPGGGNPPPDTTPPDVSRLRVTRKVFRLGGRGTVIKWSQSEAGTDTIRFERRVNGRWRKVRRKMTFQSTAGNHRLRFRGRFDRRHPLKPGRYRMTLTAVDAAGNASSPDRVRFRLLRKRRG
jgi:virginiamycin B lyase